MNRVHLLSAAALTACVMGFGVSACAQEAREFRIEAGPLGDALTVFGRQADLQIMFSGQTVAGRRTPGVEGRYTPQDALDRLLEGSGLDWSATRPGVIYIRQDAATTALGTDPTTVEDVVVTGTLLRGGAETASPVISLDRDALDRRGYGTVAEALTDLPQNYAGSGTLVVQLAGSDRQGSNIAASTGVNLRGLGPSSTLLLVNGRRVAGTGFRAEFGDVSALPSSAVERVDVLLDGASSLYGSDAVAGVVNVIMRRQFDGQETRVRFGAAQGGAEDWLISHLAGRSWEGGSGYLSYEYQSINALSSLDRPYTADGDLRAFGGSDRRTLYSGPGNIVAFDAAAGGYVSKYAIRPPAGGTARASSDFAFGAANLESLSLGVDLLPDVERHSLYGRVSQAIGDRLTVSADLRYNHRAYGLESGASIAVFNVSAANPHFVSPTGAASHQIAYSFFQDRGTSRQKGAVESVGLTAGAVYALTPTWTAEAYLAWAQEETGFGSYGRVHSRRLGEALGNLPDDPTTAYSAPRDGYFNPYGDGAANSAAVLAFISGGYSEGGLRSRAASANLLLEGVAARMPGGDLRVALGAQLRSEDFETTSTAFTSSAAPTERLTPRVERTVAAAFAEAKLPLVGTANARPGVRRLELSVAGRVEDYDDFGSTANPKFGLIWSPVERVTVRGAWGASFRAPSLPQVHDASNISVTTVPQTSGASVLALYLYGGNRDLEPETAETFTLGLDYRAPGGLFLSLGAFDAEFTDRIAQPATENLLGVLTDPALSPFVVRVSPATNAADLARVQAYLDQPGFTLGGLYPAPSYGAIIDGRWVNTGRVRVRGLDLTARYPFAIGAHAISVDASASYVLDYETRTSPTAEIRQVVDLIGFPVRLRSRLGAVWSHGGFDAGLHWSHVGDYRDRLGARIKAWNTIDGQINWSPVMAGVSGLRIALSVQNLTNERPPFHDAPSGFGFDPGQGGVLGRAVSLQLTQRW